MEIPPNEPHQPPLAEPSLVDMELRQRAEIREQKIQRGFNAPLPVGYIILLIAIILFLIIIAVMSALHLW